MPEIFLEMLALNDMKTLEQYKESRAKLKQSVSDQRLRGNAWILIRLYDKGEKGSNVGDTESKCGYSRIVGKLGINKIRELVCSSIMSD